MIFEVFLLLTICLYARIVEKVRASGESSAVADHAIPRVVRRIRNHTERIVPLARRTFLAKRQRMPAQRAGKRADRLDNFDFEELAPNTSGTVVPLAGPKL